MKWFVVVISAAAIATAAAVGLCCPLSANAQGIDAVLDRAEEALGGRAVLADIEAVRVRSHGMWEMPSRSIPPTPYQVELVYRRPDQYRLIWTFPEELGGEFTFGYDGREAWGIFGAPPARCKGWHREVVLQMAAELQVYFVTPARAVHGDSFTLDAAGTAENPVRVKVVWRPFEDGKPWNVWFDKNSGDLVMLEHDSYQMDGKLALARITRSSPTNFNGLRYPARVQFEAVRDGKVIEAAEETIDRVELNPDLPADYFACPVWEVDATMIDTKEVPAETVVKIEHRGPYGGIGKSLAPAMDAIMSAGLVPVGAASGTYLSDPNTTAPQDIRAELAIRVANLKGTEPVLPSRYVFTEQPAMRVAYAYHRGDHAGEGEAHDRLRAWMAEQGLQPAGPPRGIWYHDPEVTVTDDLVTEVQIPVR